MSNDNENPKPNYDGNRSVLLPGGLPAIKEIEPKKPAARMPQLSNRNDIAAIHNSHTASRNIESVAASLRRLLQENPTYVSHAREFLKLLAAEIAQNKSDDAS